jgi:hypothetical protein
MPLVSHRASAAVASTGLGVGQRIFSKDMKGRTQADEVRDQSGKLAQAYLTEWQTTQRYPKRLQTKLNSMHAALQGESAPRTPGELVTDALKTRAEMTDIVTKFLNDPAEKGSHDDKLNEGIVVALAGTLVIQEYWVYLYLRYISVR